ncbi:hypothetical protein ACLOJK_022782 [Asimina triloba]
MGRLHYIYKLLRIEFMAPKWIMVDAVIRQENALTMHVLQSVSINEFLKPADGEKYGRPTAGRGRGGRGRGRGERGGGGGFRGGFSGRADSNADHAAPAPCIEDPGQFPLNEAILRAQAKYPLRVASEKKFRKLSSVLFGCPLRVASEKAWGLSARGVYDSKS